MASIREVSPESLLCHHPPEILLTSGDNRHSKSVADVETGFSIHPSYYI